ncbi:hypothetical protein ACIRU8_39380 [Streptomyces sp. NPDC101175]|uniref:hypothetical protein n=1 Tax=Streptomyces sp. NPDC101175 TaxID=3366123 RepID=UPI00383679D3
MPQTWEPTKRGVRDLTAYIARNGKGTTVYTVSEQARNAAPWEDARMYSARTFDSRSPITGHWLTGHLSVEGLLAQEGTVYSEPPRGLRELGSPGRQVAGPLGNTNYEGVLDEAELRGLDKQVRDSSNPRHRRSLRSWRP